MLAKQVQRPHLDSIQTKKSPLVSKQYHVQTVNKKEKERRKEECDVTITAANYGHLTQTKRKIECNGRMTNHDKDEILQAAEPFLIGGISMTGDFIVKLWEKPAAFHVPRNIL